ncbi:hypothetical protein BSR29_01640 [Boudabousia liubingyangii]|uniref:Lipoprotein n=1 Tax=Boudabousia liubingyangii TaxID=1921764 RepID=A0A1Q5PQ90_9ACTO|nr:hypothetical protein [Boudabousia liubingyangii]OKL49682.1 hypothetical protein BSR29_01640 [Boudabousia liubingyangii]
MKNFTKRFLVATTIAASALSMTACSKADHDSKDSKSSSETQDKDQKKDQKKNQDQAEEKDQKDSDSNSSDNDNTSSEGALAYLPPRPKTDDPYPEWVKSFDPIKCIEEERPDNEAGLQDFLDCYGKTYSLTLMGLSPDVIHTMYVPAGYGTVTLTVNGNKQSFTTDEMWAGDKQDLATGEAFPGSQIDPTEVKVTKVHLDQNNPKTRIAEATMGRPEGTFKNADQKGTIQPLKTSERIIFLAYDKNHFYVQGFVSFNQQ